MPPADDSAALGRMLAASRVAIVGISDDPSRPSHAVGRYIQTHGKTIVPVNPSADEILGEPCYPALASIPEPPPVAIIFRRSEHCPGIVADAIAAGVRGVWLQQGITSDAARRLAGEHGLDYVEDRCFKVEMMYQAHES